MPLLVAVSILAALIWVTGFGQAAISEPGFARLIPNRDLRSALAAAARGIDATWIVLASIACYLALVRTDGIAAARRWSGMALFAGLVVPSFSAITSWPLGPVFYPVNLGLKIGPIPYSVPLLWLVIVLGAREFAWRVLPRAGHGTIALASAIIALATDLNLEPIAWKYRAWWLWYPTPGLHASHAPWQNFISWFFISLGLAWLMRPADVAPRVTRRPIAPLFAILFLNALALATHLALRWR
jgi:uncharacterized membrane protein